MLVATVWAAPSGAQELAWLMRADTAVRTLNFDATLVRHHGNNVRIVRIQQKRDRAGLWQHVHTDRHARCLMIPEKGAVHERAKSGLFRLLPQPNADGGSMMEMLTQHYQGSVGGQEAVAGRPCQMIAFRAKDQYRYGCDLCLDIESGLPLLLRMHKGEEEPTEQYMVTGLEVFETADAFAPDTFDKCDKNASGGRAQVTDQAPPVQIAQLPPGFAVQRSMVRTAPRTGKPVHHLVITDPMSQVSVFVLPHTGRDRLIRPRWVRHAYVVERDSHKIMVLGVVPNATKQLIGESIRFGDNR